MKRWLPGVSTIVVAAFTILLSSCIKDSISKSFTIMRPVYESGATVLQNIGSEKPSPIGTVGKLFIKGRYLFVNEPDKGVHIIDNANPAQPKPISFIKIPGNIDIAVAGTVLYADMYDELLAIDISNPSDAKLLKALPGVFPERSYGWATPYDSAYVIVGWTTKDTVIDFDVERVPSPVAYQSGGGYMVPSNSDASSKGNYIPGIAGSTARFSILNNYLYAIGNSNSLNTLDISNLSDPQLKSTIFIGSFIETLYPFNGHLFVGSQSGMFIYNTADPANPQKVGNFEHARACDPVITDGEYAFVTLRSGSACSGHSNQLDVLNVKDLTSPSLVRSYLLNNPSGLSKDGDLLFICDGTDGLKIFDAADVYNIKLVRQLNNIEPHDVIAWNNKLIVVAKEGIYQYDYNNFPEIQELGIIATATNKP